MGSERPVGLRDTLTVITQRLDWRAAAVSLGLIIAESTILHLFAGALLPTNAPGYDTIPWWLFFLLLAVGYYLPHILDVARVWSPSYEAILGAALALSFILAVKIVSFPSTPWITGSWLRETIDGLIIRPSTAERPVWIVVGIVAYTWWRGRTRGEPMLDTAYQLLRWGTLAVTTAVILVLLATPPEAAIRQQMSAMIVLYFASALAAIGVARLRLENMRSGNPLGARWVATFAVPIAVVVLVAVLVAGIFTRQLYEAVVLILAPVFWLLGMVVRVIVLTIALVVFLLIAPILWFLERQGLGNMWESDRARTGVQPIVQFQEFARNTLDVADPVRYLVVGAILLVLAGSLVRFAYRRQKTRQESTAEHRESVLAWDDVVGSLVERLHHLVHLRYRHADPLARLRGDPRWAHTLFIRETYRRFLRWAADAGTPRGPNVTPNEYQHAITEHLPEASDQVQIITNAYAAARYGREPATAEQADAVRKAWARLTQKRQHTAQSPHQNDGQ